MILRTLALLAILLPLSGCMITPRVELPTYISFDEPMPSQAPMSYSDLLCCYECQA